MHASMHASLIHTCTTLLLYSTLLLIPTCRVLYSVLCSLLGIILLLPLYSTAGPIIEEAISRALPCPALPCLTSRPTHYIPAQPPGSRPHMCRVCMYVCTAHAVPTYIHTLHPSMQRNAAARVLCTGGGKGGVGVCCMYVCMYVCMYDML